MPVKRTIEIGAEPSRCPNCKLALNGHSGPCMPQPGDLSICAHCHAPLVFADDQGHVRSPVTDEELADCRDMLDELFGTGVAP